MSDQKKNYALTINLSDAGKVLALRTILAYEAGRRGMSRGQVFVQMLQEAVNLETYPPELVEALNQVASDSRARATDKALSVLNERD